jgi:peroxiredoxin
MQSCAFTIRSDSRVKMMDNVQETSVVTHVQVKKPNQFAIRMESEKGGTQIVSDGSTLSVAIPALNQYRVRTLGSRDMSEIRKDETMLLLNGTSSGFHALPLICLDPNPYASIMEDVVSISYEGLDTVDGQEAHRLHFEQETIDLDLWLSRTQPVTLIRVEPDLKEAIEEIHKQLPEDAEKPQMSIRIHFSGWDFEAPTTGNTFAFTPPEGAEKVDSFIHAPGKSAKRMIGARAPDFEMELLSGKTVSLSAHHKKDVVILAFWASWSAPCRDMQPLIAKLAHAFKDRPVSVYTVNVQESRDKVTTFLKAQGLELDVALDSDGALGDKYGVAQLPQTVVIDRDGTIADVHVGFTPELAGQLTDQVTGLLAREKKSIQ